jgi:hypothetical protein
MECYLVAMSDPVYRHEEQTRRPVMFLAAAAALGFAGLAGFHGAPWYVYAPVLLALLLSGWGIAFNRRSGVAVSKDEIELYSGSWRRSLQTVSVKNYRVNLWSEGPDCLYLMLADGEKFLIPTTCAGPTAALREALESVGIQKED